MNVPLTDASKDWWAWKRAYKKARREQVTSA